MFTNYFPSRTGDEHKETESDGESWYKENEPVIKPDCGAERTLRTHENKNATNFIQNCVFLPRLNDEVSTFTYQFKYLSSLPPKFSSAVENEVKILQDYITESISRVSQCTNSEEQKQIRDYLATEILKKSDIEFKSLDPALVSSILVSQDIH